MKKILYTLNIITLVLLMCSCSSVDYSIYEGTWASEDIGWLNGGYILDIKLNDDEMEIYCSNTQGTPASRIAEINETIKLSDIKDSMALTEYEDDGWGNSGKLIITFSEDSITCKFSDIVEDELSNWGFYETEVIFVKDDEAHEKMEYTQEEYDAMFPPKPSYDTSKASGILASLGMTEEQFRESCQELDGWSTSQNPNPIHTGDLRDYPSKYVGQHFYDSGFEVTTKGMSNDGYTTYKNYQYEMLLFDMRDDIYSPTISQGDYLKTTYMIYTGVQTLNGIDFACFRLIAIDK